MEALAGARIRNGPAVRLQERGEAPYAPLASVFWRLEHPLRQLGPRRWLDMARVQCYCSRARSSARTRNAEVIVEQLKQGRSSDQQPKRKPVSTGEGADSAFGKMVEDRPLVHRPEPKSEPQPQQQISPPKL